MFLQCLWFCFLLPYASRLSMKQHWHRPIMSYAKIMLHFVPEDYWKLWKFLYAWMYIYVVQQTLFTKDWILMVWINASLWKINYIESWPYERLIFYEVDISIRLMVILRNSNLNNFTVILNILFKEGVDIGKSVHWLWLSHKLKAPLVSHSRWKL